MLIQADSKYIPLKNNSIQMVVTSPPYFGLRKYAINAWKYGDSNCNHESARLKTRMDYPTSDKQLSNKGTQIPSYKSECLCGAKLITNEIGVESSINDYVSSMIQVGREIYRILKNDGVFWLNIDDSYNDSYNGSNKGYSSNKPNSGGEKQRHNIGSMNLLPTNDINLKPKELCGIPWRVALALQEDGWWLRDDIIWHNINCMPESVLDRPTRAHEYIFMLTKSKNYYYNAKAIEEVSTYAGNNIVLGNKSLSKGQANAMGRTPSGNDLVKNVVVKDTKNKRDVWVVPHEALSSIYIYENADFTNFGLIPYIASEDCPNHSKLYNRKKNSKEQLPLQQLIKLYTLSNNRGICNCSISESNHFAAFPQKLIEPCILSSSRENDLVLDPFIGSGTTGIVCNTLNRKWIGLDLSWEYIKLCKIRALGEKF